MIKRNFVYVDVNDNKETRMEFNNEETGLAAFEHLIEQLYETGKIVKFYNARTGRRIEVKA